MEAGPVRLPLSEPDSAGKALLEKLLRSVTLS
jgi:hypothetical protein